MEQQDIAPLVMSVLVCIGIIAIGVLLGLNERYGGILKAVAAGAALATYPSVKKYLKNQEKESGD